MNKKNGFNRFIAKTGSAKTSCGLWGEGLEAGFPEAWVGVGPAYSGMGKTPLVTLGGTGKGGQRLLLVGSSSPGARSPQVPITWFTPFLEGVLESTYPSPGA